VRRAAALPVLVAAAALGGCGGGGGTPAPTTTAAATPRSPFAGQPVLADSKAEDFALHDQNGKLIRLSAERGHVVALTFLYTQCRDVCPLIADHLGTAVATLTPAQRNDVRLIAVSVDPENDTPAAVKEFLRAHGLGPSFHYLIGTRAELAPVWQAYNVLSTRRNESVVDHSAPTLLIDRRGRPRVYFESDFTSRAVAHDLRVLLR
jgi:protein SCO1